MLQQRREDKFNSKTQSSGLIKLDFTQNPGINSNGLVPGQAMPVGVTPTVNKVKTS